MSEDPQATADTLRGILRVTVGDEERGLRKLKLYPAEEWFDRHAKALGSFAHIDAAELDGNPEATAVKLRELNGALLAAIADYDTEGVLGGVEGLRADLYPHELLPLFIAMRDAALPFVDMLRDHREPEIGNGASPSMSSTNGPTPTGATTRTPSAGASTRASSKRSGQPAASA